MSLKEEKRFRDHVKTQTSREQRARSRQAWIGDMLPEARECLGLSEAEKKKKKKGRVVGGRVSPIDFRGTEALLTAHFQNPDRINFYLLQLIQAPIYGCLNKIRH